MRDLLPASESPSWRDTARQTARAFALFALFPNLIFWLLEYRFDLGRSVFNLDYLMAGVLFAIGWRRLGAGLLVLLFALDVLVLVGQVYPFLRLQDLVYLAGLLPRAPGVFQLFVIVMVLYLLGLAMLMVRHGRHLLPVAALIPLNIGLLAYGVHVYGDPDRSERMWRMRDDLVIDSQSINFIEGRMGGFFDSFTLSGEPFEKVGFHGGTERWTETPVEQLSPKLLLVVVESWGFFRDEKIRNGIVAPLLEASAGFEWLEQGDIAFAGATVAGELRELCGLRLNHFNLKNVETGFESCLPRRLHEHGYATAAVHGAVGLMYDRIHWYPRAGFDELHFMETQDWESRCYSFPGICDSEIAQRFIKGAFSGSGKRFVYWLTLNSHSIYDERDLHGDFFDCGAHGLPQGSELCRASKLHAQLFSDLAAIVGDAAMQGVEVLVVGDHPPPLLSTPDKEAYLEPDTVPWLHFRVRDGRATPIAEAVN
jgi:hypothetical protein